MRRMCLRATSVFAGSRVLLETVYFTAVLEGDEIRRCCEPCSDMIKSVGITKRL